ncbi:hypothetical protein [Clostridium estertheticum]|uniref:hypothetical protein n=1 Tax=Clostridium estertheticum TaxID=238834 RepID=UPI00124F27FA|nr:hypothetical protein [Clostridium estertheticum]MBZ9616793.1 hypothetical protein [Clostridium estertheticum subsp. laramiense]WAG72500.1 hypothetical protein LL032_15245 [Clostridium estertheticum]
MASGNKKSNNFVSLLYKKFTIGRQTYYYYFMWRNKLSNSKTDLSVLSEEEFIYKYCRKKSKGVYNDGSVSFNNMKMWESTEEYQGHMQELYSFKMNQDFYKLYETYLTKAMAGDEKALNSLKTIKKEIESLNKASRTKTKVVEETQYDMK